MSERVVASPILSEDDSPKQFGHAMGQQADMALSPKAIEFKVAEYENFRVEYAMVDDDFIIHFFITPRQIQMWSEPELEHWWLNDFAQVMDRVAQEYFDAGPPRLQAKYTREVASWWLKAQGYGHFVSPEAFLLGFFEQLDGTFLKYADPPPASTGAMG